MRFALCFFKEVIPTFLIDTPVMVLLGMLYTPLEREPEKRFYRTKTFQASCRLAGLFLVLVVVSYIFYPDWMWMYFVTAKELGILMQAAIVVYVLLALYLLPFVAGYFLGANFYSTNKIIWWASVFLNLAIEGLLIIALWNRYNSVGTLEEFLNGTTRSLTDFHLLSGLLNGGGILLVVLGIWQWRRLSASSN
jgi:hypothetical protein